MKAICGKNGAHIPTKQQDGWRKKKKNTIFPKIIFDLNKPILEKHYKNLRRDG